MDQIETMRAHRRFTLVGEGSLRGDPEGAWTTYRHLEERLAAERRRIRKELLAAAENRLERDYLRMLLDRICPVEE